MKGLLIGLTGGIGSGKSVAADRFAARGAAVIDADAVAHELTGPGGAAMAKIREAFGEQVLASDGSLDRTAMRKRVFADAGERQRLEAILHPLIRAECDARRDAAWAAGVPYVVMVIPLLIEPGLQSSGQTRRFDRVVVVDCPEEKQITRVMTRNGLSRAEVLAIMSAQATRPERLAAADDVVQNDNGIEGLHRQVEALHENYCAQADKLRAGG